MWGQREGKRGCTTKIKAWKRTWKKFPGLVSITRSGETVLHWRSALPGVRGLQSLSLQERSYQSKTGRQEALKQIKRRRCDWTLPKPWKQTLRSIVLGRVGVPPSALMALTSLSVRMCWLGRAGRKVKCVCMWARCTRNVCMTGRECMWVREREAEQWGVRQREWHR